MVSDAAKKFMDKHFKGREFYVGLDSAILIGHPVTVASAIILIPIVLVVAMILPGTECYHLVIWHPWHILSRWYLVSVKEIYSGLLFRGLLL